MEAEGWKSALYNNCCTVYMEEENNEEYEEYMKLVIYVIRR